MSTSTTTTQFRTTHRTVILIVALVSLVSLFRSPGADAQVTSVVDGVRLNAVEARLVALMNQARTSRGIPRLVVVPGATDVARRWAAVQLARQTLMHNPDYKNQIAAAGSAGWRTMGENVGVSGDVDSLFQAYMDSPGHRANILNRAYRFLGIGWVEAANSRGYNTQSFVDAYSSSYGPSREPAHATVTGSTPFTQTAALASFEAGSEPRALTTPIGSGIGVSKLLVDPATAGDQAGRFATWQSLLGTGGGAELRLREAIDLSRARSLRLTIGAVSKSRRPTTILLALRRAGGSTVVVARPVVPSGTNVTIDVPLTSATAGYWTEAVVSVPRTSLAALDPLGLLGRHVTVYVRDLTVVV